LYRWSSLSPFVVAFLLERRDGWPSSWGNPQRLTVGAKTCAVLSESEPVGTLCEGLRMIDCQRVERLALAILEESEMGLDLVRWPKCHRTRR
jgi:hypothetical protein